MAAPRGRRFTFYATCADLAPILASIENRFELQYVEASFSERPAPVVYGSASEISSLGTATGNSSVSTTRLLVLPQEVEVKVRPVLGYDGILRHSIDQLDNPASIIFTPG